MVQLAIRDDDTNFFTKIEDLEFIYKEIPSFPISYAIIPEVLDVSFKGECKETDGNSIPRSISDNTELVSWLRERYNNNECDILLHGYHHKYTPINGHWIAEMKILNNAEVWIPKCKTLFAELFGQEVKTFVAPNNEISKKNISIISNNDLFFSGIIEKGFNRNITPQNMINYLHRSFVRITNKLPYPGILNYGNHLELNACNLDKPLLYRMFKYCKLHDLPMAINTHYWGLRDNSEQRRILVDFVKYAIAHGAQPTTIRSIFYNYLQSTE